MNFLSSLKTVDAIVSHLTRTITRLENLASAKSDKADRLIVKAKNIRAEADATNEEVVRARKIARNLETLLS